MGLENYALRGKIAHAVHVAVLSLHMGTAQLPVLPGATAVEEG
ncbi:hypothetical protein [uncultured Marinobacter sp.]